MQIIPNYFAYLFMIRDLKAFYVAIIDNEVVCFETNLSLFVERFNKMQPTSRNYDWFYRQFKTKTRFNTELSCKSYFFQKVV